jgi:hypothetical protein
VPGGRFVSVYEVPVSVAMRVAALGVNPAVVERWTRYSVTAVSSVAAAQVSPTSSSVTVAVGVPGAVGGAVSVAGGSILSVQPRDGTPLSSIANTWYQPGGAMLAFAGPSTSTVPAGAPDRRLSHWKR